MENLPSPPQQLPACLHVWPRSSSPSACLPRAKWSPAHAHSGPCRLGPGDGQLVPGWPNRPAAHLVWARGGAGEEGSSGAQADGVGRGPKEPRAPPHRETQTREGRCCPRPHSAGEANTPTQVHLSGSWGQLCTQDVFFGLRPALDIPMGAQVYVQTQDAQPGNTDSATSKVGTGHITVLLGASAATRLHCWNMLLRTGTHCEHVCNLWPRQPQMCRGQSTGMGQGGYPPAPPTHAELPTPAKPQFPEPSDVGVSVVWVAQASQPQTWVPIMPATSYHTSLGGQDAKWGVWGRQAGVYHPTALQGVWKILLPGR